MGNRLPAIATRTGDDGSTGLGAASRVGKAAARVSVMGDVDEFNSAIGLRIAFGVPDDEALAMPALPAEVQQDLRDLGAELSIPGCTLPKAERVAGLDAWLKDANALLPRRAEFIRPGGSLPAAQAHVCRTVCRRAERAAVELVEDVQGVSECARQYLNRPSELLFVMARILNRACRRRRAAVGPHAFASRLTSPSCNVRKRALR